MSDCPNAESRIPPDHCYHPMGPPYAVQDETVGAVPGIGECCCFCGAARVKILRERPLSAEGHGEHLLFITPTPAPPPKPGLIVPGPRKVLH